MPVTGGGTVSLSRAEFDQFRTWLYDTTGISLAEHKMPLLTSRLSKRLAALGLSSYSQYFALLQSGEAPGEVQTARDLLTTNETYFFREPKHFEFLAQRILAPRKAHGGAKPLRIWCAASSSGEEPYTLAMVLAESLGLERPWEILASDISSRVLRVARTGLYPMARAERIPTPLLQRWCLKGVRKYEGSFLIDQKLRERVSFRELNLIEPLPEIGQFDVIFIRNVMIYFDGPTKAQVVRRVADRLIAGGVLVVSHSENLHGILPDLEVLQPSIYRKRA